MRHLLNTLFVTSEDIYLSLDGENVVASREKTPVARYPLHTLSAILTFSYPGASPALMGACAQQGISLSFCTPRGKFLARVSGEANGNVLLRRAQYRAADDPSQSCAIARAMVFGKVYNARWSIERTRRDHGLRVDDQRLGAASGQLKALLPQLLQETDLDSLRGLEGAGATAYFGVFDQLILGDRSLFRFQTRSRRPPLDPVNALLSFAYSLLSHDCAWALESAGLDSYVGFLHRDRPGRSSLALDLMEEFRPCMADRFVLTCINNRIFQKSDFVYQENGGVLLSESGRKTFLRRWQERKKDSLTHPFLGEKVPWGLVPYLQALLLARYLRGDLDAYPPFCGSENAILVLITYDVNMEDAAGRRRPRPQVLLPTGRTTHSIKVRTDSGHTLSGRLAPEQDSFFAELPGSHRCDSIPSAEMDAAFSHVTNAQVYFCAYLLSLPTRGAWIEIHCRNCCCCCN